MTVNPELAGLSFEAPAANANHIVARDEAIHTLKSFLTVRLHNPPDESLSAMREALKRYVDTIRAVDPQFKPSNELRDLVRECYVADLARYPSVWSQYFTEIYDVVPGIFDGGIGGTEFGENVSQTMAARLQEDTKTAGYIFLHTYIANVDAAHKKLGLSPMDQDDRRNIAQWLCDRLKSDLQKGNVIAVDELIYDINRTLRLNELEISTEHRMGLAALITSNGLSMLGRSFTDAAIPDAPSNEKIMESTLCGLMRVGVEPSDIGGVKRTLDESFARAQLRQVEWEQKQMDVATGVSMATPCADTPALMRS